MGFHLKNGKHIGEQLVSHRTMVKSIRILPITSTLRIDRVNKKLEEITNSFEELFSIAPGISYEDKLLETLERGSGLIGALLNVGIPVNLSLSGGYDSRLVLCMALASKANIDNLRISSATTKEDDYRVAEAICERLSLPLNIIKSQRSSKRLPSLTASDAIRMYLLSCAGSYLPFYPVNAYRMHDNPEIKMTGDHPIGISFFAGNAQFNGDVRKIGIDIREYLVRRGFGEAVQKEYLSTFEQMGVDCSHPAAMMAYYSATRARHHGGRNWYKSLGNTLLITPLMQSSFIGLGLHNGQVGGYSGKSGIHAKKKFYADIFSVFGGWAVEEAFETADRALPQDLLYSSSFKGGVSLTPKKFTVFGRPGHNFDSVDESIHSIPICRGSQVDSIKEELGRMLQDTHYAKESNVFMEDDFTFANEEVMSSGSLSHNYRKTCHILSIEIISRIIDNTNIN